MQNVIKNKQQHSFIVKSYPAQEYWKNYGIGWDKSRVAIYVNECKNCGFRSPIETTWLALDNNSHELTRGGNLPILK